MKLYVRESGTLQMLDLIADPEAHRFAILSLARAELYSAIRRRERAGEISSILVAQLLNRFESHLETHYLRQSVSDSLLDLACGLIDRHPLRAYDALQIAGCLMLRTTAPEPLVFVCADQRLLNVAQLENLTCMDPTT